MSNPGALRKRMFVLFTQLRMEGRITKGDWKIFKRVTEEGIKALFSSDPNRGRNK